MSHSNIVIEQVYNYLTSNKPTSIDVEFKNDYFLDKELTQEELDDLNPTEVRDGIMLISLDEEIPQTQNNEKDNGNVKTFNTIYYDYKLSKITKDFGFVKHKNIKFKLTIKTEKDRFETNMNAIIDHYYDVVYLAHKGKIPITVDGNERYIYLRNEPTTKKTKNKKDDISEYEFIFECFYAI